MNQHQTLPRSEPNVQPTEQEWVISARINGRR